MVNVIYDKRKWTIKLILDNSQCPYLFFPNSVHGCEKSINKEGECQKELCPYRIEEGK